MWVVHSVHDPEFKDYGQVVTGYDVEELKNTLDAVTPLPEGTVYVPEQEELQNLAITKDISDRLFGGMPIEMGFCNGHNTKQGEIGDDHILDTAKVKAFKAPAGVLIEVFATTLHYAPCNAKSGQGFKVLVVLPKGTNTKKPEFVPANHEDVRGVRHPHNSDTI